jgi:levanbiose-producing levanase
VVRDGDAVAAGEDGARTRSHEYAQVRSGEGKADRHTVRLTAYVDRSSVEVFVEGGRQTLTSLVFPPSGAKDVRLAAEGGPVNVKSGTVTPLASIR